MHHMAADTPFLRVILMRVLRVVATTLPVFLATVLGGTRYLRLIFTTYSISNFLDSIFVIL